MTKDSWLCLVLVLTNIKCQKEDKEFCDEKGVNVFSSNSCWNRCLVKNLLPAKTAKWFLKSS